MAGIDLSRLDDAIDDLLILARQAQARKANPAEAKAILKAADEATANLRNKIRLTKNSP